MHIKAALAAVRMGESVPSALYARASYTKSRYCKRALAQLALCYEGDGSVEGLARLSEEMSASAMAKTREFCARVSFLALLFVGVCSLAPAFFAIFIIIGGKFLMLEISPALVWAGYALAFPLFAAAVLAAIYADAPAAVGGKMEYAMRMEIAGREIGKGESVALFAAGMLPLACVLAFFPAWWAIAPALLVCALPFWAYFSPLYAKMKQDERLENALPDALFHASSLLKGSSMEKAISALAQGGYGVLSEKFAHAKRQVQSGGWVDEALLNLQSSSASVLFSRFCGLLLQAYHTGADMKAALRRAASDMMANFALVRERSAVLSMQKYTLFFGGAIVVPLILGSVLRMSVALSGGGFFEAGGGEMFRAGLGGAGGSGADGRGGGEGSVGVG